MASKEPADDEWPEEAPSSKVPAVQPELHASACPGGPNAAGDVVVAVSIHVPELPAGTSRPPVDICCVIDISGSMDTPVTIEVDGEQRDDGLNSLDVVKHACRVVIKSLKPGDRLCIVAFESQAWVTLQMTEMDEAGQAKALEALEAVATMGSTNIWAGMFTGLELLREGHPEAGRKQTMLLLTDGQPDAQNQVTELLNYKDTHANFTFQMNTFGFGYNLQSDLLLQTSETADGTFAFIPDALILGTTFVDCMANCLSCFSQRSTLSIMPSGGATLVGPVLAGHKQTEESWGKAVSLGPLQYGANREVVFHVKVPAASAENHLEIVLTYPTTSGTQAKQSIKFSCGTPGERWAQVAALRADMVDVTQRCIAKGQNSEVDQACAEMQALASRLEAARGGGAGTELVRSKSASLTDAGLTALLADVSGRGVKSLTGSDRFNRWGKHYLKALVRAHQIQFCTNYMDPGLQLFGGEGLFKAMRTAGDEIFITLPPPKPSRGVSGAAPGSGAGTGTATGPDMNTYYAGGGGG